MIKRIPNGQRIKKIYDQVVIEYPSKTRHSKIEDRLIKLVDARVNTRKAG